MPGKKHLELFRAAWGGLKSAGGRMSMEEFLPAVKSLGYKGVEMPLVLAFDHGPAKLLDQLEEHGLSVIFQAFSDGPMAPGHPSWQLSSPNVASFSHPEPSEADVDVHLLVLQKQLEAAATLFDRDGRLSKLNCHSMRDFHSISQANAFFSEMIPFQDSLLSAHPDIECVLHETHRARFLYSPWVCRDFLHFAEYGGNGVSFDHSKLFLTADLAHFTCIAEAGPGPELGFSVLNDVVRHQVAPKVRHIHGRVGYEHSPQVSDPRAPEWAAHVKGFESWWDDLITEMVQKPGSVTFTPEHGPAPYQPSLPYTQAPVADVWEINTWVGENERKRFEKEYHHKYAKHEEHSIE